MSLKVFYKRSVVRQVVSHVNEIVEKTRMNCKNFSFDRKRKNVIALGKVRPPPDRLRRRES